jgi:hypothetical protein
MKAFEVELYEAMCEAFPKTTVRSISRAMGMSEGYWSSLSAQGLKVSTVAMMRLIEHLEVRLVQWEAESAKSQRLKAIQLLISKEIVARFAHEVDAFDLVWSEISAVAARKHDALSGSYGAMPFVMLCH